jgi:choline dehydrogenase-like flavoprotein
MILKGSDVKGPVRESVDVCVIGSGAGGAVVAKELAQGGLSVVVLEKGGHYTREDFTMREWEMSPRLYAGNGVQLSLNGSVAVVQGQCVGGSTVINEALCFRAPARILGEWASRFGVKAFGPADLAPHYADVEREIHVQDTPDHLVNENNRILLRGARALGYRAGVMRRNVKDCLGCGFCQFGCPFDRKQDMRLTYLPKAVAAGARVYANAPVSRIQFDWGLAGHRVGAVLGEVQDPETGKKRFPLRVNARVVVVAAGAIASSHILYRSGLPFLRVAKLRHPVVGDRLTLHASFEVLGEFDRPVHAHTGALMTAYTDHFFDSDNFVLEGVFTHPMTFANLIPGAGRAHQEMMLRYDRMSAIGVIIHDTEGGQVLPVGFRYGLTSQTRRQAVKAASEAARILFAAGARRVHTTHRGGLSLDSPADIEKIERRGFAPSEILLGSAHPQGGNPMGGDPRRSIVDSTNESHDVKGLFVCDASAFPSSVGVNPQLTIMAMARRAAHRILGNRGRWFGGRR